MKTRKWHERGLRGSQRHERGLRFPHSARIDASPPLFLQEKGWNEKKAAYLGR
jgi:hypothetical protein